MLRYWWPICHPGLLLRLGFSFFLCVCCSSARHVSTLALCCTHLLGTKAKQYRCAWTDSTMAFHTKIKMTAHWPTYNLTKHKQSSCEWFDFCAFFSPTICLLTHWNDLNHSAVLHNVNYDIYSYLWRLFCWIIVRKCYSHVPCFQLLIFQVQYWVICYSILLFLNYVVYFITKFNLKIQNKPFHSELTLLIKQTTCFANPWQREPKEGKYKTCHLLNKYEVVPVYCGYYLFPPQRCSCTGYWGLFLNHLTFVSIAADHVLLVASPKMKI